MLAATAVTSNPRRTVEEEELEEEPEDLTTPEDTSQTVTLLEDKLPDTLHQDQSQEPLVQPEDGTELLEEE